MAAARSMVSTTRPLRRMVMRCESRITSSMRCEMNSTRQPSRARPSIRREDRLAVVEVERRGHLVEDQDARLPDQRAGEHDELLGGERQPAGLDVEIDRGGRAAAERVAGGGAALARAAGCGGTGRS